MTRTGTGAARPGAPYQHRQWAEKTDSLEKNVLRGKRRLLTAGVQGLEGPWILTETRRQEGQLIRDLNCQAKDLGLDPVGGSKLLKDFREKLYHQKWA